MPGNQHRPIVAVVDGYTTGNFLPDAFARLGADAIHVQSTPETIRTQQLPPDITKYRLNVVHATTQETADRLREHGVRAVVSGQESGVLLADELAVATGLVGNDTRRSAAKRNKYEMIETVRRAGLRCADQELCTSSDEALAWAQAHGRYPLVVKPVSSASTDGVSVCYCADDLRRGCDNVLGSRDVFDMRNDVVLVQSYLDGDEYIVDTVSARGSRYVAGVWRYEKNLVDGRNIYDRDILVPAEDHRVIELVEYADRVLDAFGIEWGPAHIEVKMTSGGPALVEIGARLNGNMDPGFHDVCLGANQAELTALAYLDPDHFVDAYGGRAYRMIQPATVYNTPSTSVGTVQAIDGATVKQIEAIDSVHRLSVKLRPGQHLAKTVDLRTSPLRVFLTGPTDDMVERDYLRVQELKDQVYVL